MRITILMMLVVASASRAAELKAIVGAKLIDGTSREAIEDSVVLVDGETIVAVGKHGDVRIPKESRVTNAAGFTVVPGLIDAHFHLDGRLDLPNLFLRHGVTAVRDPGAWNQTYEPIRKAEAAQPRLFLCGPHLDCMPVAHPKDALIIKSAEEARAAANRLVDEGAATIKVYYRLPVEWIAEVTKTAHARGTPVTGHLELVRADDAINAGLDGIEHVTSFGTAIADAASAEKFEAAVRVSNEARRNARYELWVGVDLENERVGKVIELAVKKGTVLCPTLAVFEAREGDKGVTAEKAAAFAKMLKFTGMYAKAGGKIVVGSHSEVPRAERGWAYQREMELLVEAGLTPAEVMRCATLEGAKYFRAQKTIGSIEVGKRADLVLIEGDPLKEIGAMRNVRRVMLDGKWVDLAAPNVKGELLRGERFADVTAESGVAKLLDEKYAADPKWWLSGVHLIDLDGDGKLDLFLGAHGGGSAVAALNDGKGKFELAKGDWPAREAYLPADINEDGKVDLLVTHGDGEGRWWINQSEPGKLSFKQNGLGAGRARCNAWVDINRDGLADWLHEDANGFVFEFGDGKGGLRKGGSLKVVEAAKFETNMIPVDVNGDGQMDSLAQWGRYAFEQGWSRVYLNDGKGVFVVGDSGLVEEGTAIKGAGDVNQDGHVDLMVLEKKQPAIYLNDGKGKFSKSPHAIAGAEQMRKAAYASWGMAVVTDFDNDGVADVLWNGRNFLWVLRGTGEGKLEYVNRRWGIEDSSAASVDDGHCFGDIDGDGDLDVIGYDKKIDGQRRLRVYRSDVAAGNALRVRLIGKAGNRAAAGAVIRVSEGGTMLWTEQVMNFGSQSAHSYYAGGVTERHFGLGERREVDVTVKFYPSGKEVRVKGRGVIEVREE